MKLLRKFNEHTSYEAEVNVGGEEFKIPNVSYCKDVKDVHFNPYNLIKFYVGEITGTTPQTVSIYTDDSTSIDVTVSEENKWYSYLLPKDNLLYRVEGDSVKKVIVKADIDAYGGYIIPNNTVEASFNGSKATDTTRYVFSGCTSLTSLTLSNFDTSKVSTMRSMFYKCSNLTSLDLSRFDTSNASDISFMFYGCAALTSLDLSSFNTSNVTNMSYMLDNCTSLTSLDVSSFDTSKLTIMGGMFNGCTSLTSLDLSSFNTSKVNDMDRMFYGCAALTSLTLSNFNTSNVTHIDSMFAGCKVLKTIRMAGCTQDTVDKIKAQLKTDGITGVTITQ